MKRKLKYLVCVILAVLLAVSSTTAFAQTVLVQDNALEQVRQNTQIIVSELEKEGTSVLEQLNRQKTDYQQMLQAADSAGEREKIQELITQTDSFISQYEANSGSQGFYRAGEEVYAMAILSVIAYFNLKGYKLSSELLTFAANNKEKAFEAIYEPVNGALVKQSPVFHQIIKDPVGHGNSDFPNAGNKVQLDLYYSIHGFQYYIIQCGERVVIVDVYDYDGGDYKDMNSIGNVAVKTMSIAQTMGLLIPYTVWIDVPC